tara:strand:- start:18 stop:404 length:387 start_codon:yes stop_codon:yes gene_type:complete
MTTLETILLTLLSIDAIALTVLVLLQQGKGADVGAAFGSGSSNTVFGASGSAPFLTKLTTWLAIVFFAITFGIAYLAKERVASVDIEGIPQINVERGNNEVIDLSLSKDSSGSDEDEMESRDDSIPEL